MKVSSDWLRNWLSRTILSDSELVTALERAGIEVEQLITAPSIDAKVIVGVVKKVAQHPNAERLKLAEVDVGDRQLHIVCGAPNLKTGMKVAVAQIGTKLAGGDKIEQVKLRGEVSEGMLCSEMELGVGRDHAGILGLPADSIVGSKLCDMFSQDAVIDLKTPANRFDLQSIHGLAREVAAMTSAKLVDYKPKLKIPDATGPAVGLKPEGVGRYMLSCIDVDQSSPTPAQMVSRLRSAGMRSIGPVVDVTNYVMLELGQPLHAFDAAKVQLPVTVRYAKSGESLVTLDGEKRLLEREDLVIADQSGPIALAGIMGGLATEVGSDTKQILLESATFDSATVRKMAVRHSLRSEASARMERGLPAKLQLVGTARVVELLEEVAHGKLVSVRDVFVRKPETRHIEMQVDKLSALAGVAIASTEAVAMLEKLQIRATKSASGASGGVVSVSEVPWWRPDLTVWQDLAEEVVRVIGYDRIPSTIPSWRPAKLLFDSRWAGRRTVRDLLYGAGLFEVMTYSFVSREQIVKYGLSLAGHLKVKNPLTAEQAYLRSAILASHLAVAERNRTYAKEFGFFEIANVFATKGEGKQPDEPLKLAVTLCRTDGSYSAIKGILDSLLWTLNVSAVVTPETESNFAVGRSASIVLDDKTIGMIGQVAPEIANSLKMEGEIAYFEIELGLMLASSTVRQFHGLHRFPTIRRDISLVLPVGTTWREVSEAAKPEDLVFVSDYYGSELPAGKKVMTVRLEVADPDRTPTEAEASDAEAKLLAVLQRKVEARRRD